MYLMLCSLKKLISVLYTSSSGYGCTALVSDEDNVLSDEGAVAEWDVSQRKIDGLIAILIEPSIQQFSSAKGERQS